MEAQRPATRQSLVAEVPASAPGRRGFVSVRHEKEPEDALADAEGWTRPSSSRSFHIDHWEYDEQWQDTWDYDIGAAHVSHARATSEAELVASLARLGLAPADFSYPWQTAIQDSSPKPATAVGKPASGTVAAWTEPAGRKVAAGASGSSKAKPADSPQACFQTRRPDLSGSPSTA